MQPVAEAREGGRRIALVLLPNFNALASMALLDPFRAANYLRGPAVETQSLYRWRFLTLAEGDGPAPVAASNGLEVMATPLAASGDEVFDLIFLCASWAPERYRDAKLFAWLRRQTGQGAVLGGVDTGAFLLAFAGLLDGYRATVHYEHLAAFEELFPRVEPSAAPYVLDRNRLTASGGMAAGDLALEVLRRDGGADLADAAARYIVHRPPPQASEEQPPGHRLPAALRQAVTLMEARLEDPLPLGEIAANVGRSERQLQRLFRRFTGLSPLQYYLDRRLDRARGMVTQTDLSILEISVACGFASPEYMTKCYRKRFFATPSADRVVGRVPFQFRSFPAYALSGVGQSNRKTEE
ncbi:MAG: GlxA family transcriptional regulator [Rhodospirillales bacterium]